MRKLQYSEDIDAPCASITSNNHDQKVYEDNVIFLNNGQNFEIKLFNPTQTKIGANISINGQSTNKLLILNPGQSFILDRFLDDNKKMLFETYEIDGSNEKAVKAIEKNGLVEITFHKEKIEPLYSASFSTFNTFNCNSRCYDTKSSNFGGKIKGKQMLSNNYGTSVSYNDSINTTLTSSVSLDNLLETGRVEKGDTSNQYFEKVDTKFESNYFHKIIYKLLPVSQKETVTTQEIRMYCPACSYRKRKQSWKFCPSCGEKYDF